MAAQGATQYRVGYDASFGGQAWNDFDMTERSWMLMPGDGVKEVFVQYRDAVGNTTLPVSASIELDTAAPSAPFIEVAGGDAFTNALAVTANLSAIDAVHMRLSADGTFDDEPWVDYAATAEVQLQDQEGEQRVAVEFRDLAGNVSPAVSDAVYRDTTPPELKSLALLNVTADENGVLWVTEEGATLAVDVMADDGLSGVAAVALVEAASEPNPDDLTFDAVFASPGLFLKTEYVTLTTDAGPTQVYLFLRDRAGNTTATAGTLAVTVDAQGPIFAEPAITVTNAMENGQIYADQAALVLNIADEAPPASMRVGLQPLTAANGRVPFASEVVVPLPAQSGTPVAFEVEVFDEAGNKTEAVLTGYAVNRTGWLRGNIVLETRQPSNAAMDTTLKLYAAGSDLGTAPEDIETVTPSGEFEFAEVPAGAGMTLVVSGQATNRKLWPCPPSKVAWSPPWATSK